MAALGVWQIWTGNAAVFGSYNHQERCETISDGHQVEELLHERLDGPEEAVASGGGQTGDVRDRLVVDDDLYPRTTSSHRDSRYAVVYPSQMKLN